jgi:hypothetical protein
MSSLHNAMVKSIQQFLRDDGLVRQISAACSALLIITADLSAANTAAPAKEYV